MTYLALMMIYDHGTLSITFKDIIIDSLGPFLDVTSSLILIKVIRSVSIIAH
jgi:hypothetical protein